MARTGITEYDLLISCPGDVEKFKDVIEEAVEKFNRLFGRTNSVLVNAKYWKSDSYSQMGDRPQNILNRQLVNKCDMLIAVFWTKFGTPTDRYGSGTEEEIEQMISSVKQVFLYFLDKPCPPSEYSSDYENVRKFKKRCNDRGLYKVVSDERELSEKFYEDLTQHFVEILNGEKNLSVQNTFGGVQNIYSSGEGYFGQTPIYASGNRLKKEKEAEIIQKILNLQRNTLPGRTSGSAGIPGTVSDAVIYRYQKELIMDFAEEYGIRIDSTFWNLGNLRRRVIGGGRVDCDGRAEEMKRYKEIQDLCGEIEEFNRI